MGNHGATAQLNLSPSELRGIGEAVSAVDAHMFDNQPLGLEAGSLRPKLMQHAAFRRHQHDPGLTKEHFQEIRSKMDILDPSHNLKRDHGGGDTKLVDTPSSSSSSRSEEHLYQLNPKLKMAMLKIVQVLVRVRVWVSFSFAEAIAQL